MDRIDVEGIRLYGFHGCLDEEGKIGTEYHAEVSVWADLSEPARTDKLSQTVDYVTINAIVEKEVSQRSKLIETVVKRILDHILRTLPQVQTARVKLSKCYPPINGDVDRVSVTMERSR
jgi:dihydroneopterin aldolase